MPLQSHISALRKPVLPTMAPFRLDSILIIDPKSEHTLVQLGINDETFMIPDWKVPSRIYRERLTGHYFSQMPPERSADPDVETVYPIVNGEIRDLDAFLQLLRTIYGSVLAEKSSENPGAFDLELATVPLLLITHHSWSQLQLETIARFVFEDLKMAGLVLLPTSLAAAYAMISLQNCCVIDIGANRTSVLPVVDFTPMNHLASTLSVGGNLINETLHSTHLPQLNEEQIEALKKSAVFEVLSDEGMRKRHQDSLNGADGAGHDANEDDVINIADIVTSGRDTREVLEERERAKKEKNVPNAELEFNYFWDSKGNNIKVGKQRFQGCDPLIEQISRRVGITLSQISDVAKTRAIWENIIVIGGTSFIPGFKEKLIDRLVEDHLIEEPEHERAKREEDENGDSAGSRSNRKKNHKAFQNIIASSIPTVEYTQAPTAIKLAKYAEYFPEWKKYGYGEIQFLGGQVVAKQVFTHSRDVFYVTRESYNKYGPSCIWDTEF